MMEVIHSTNITFNANEIRANSNENVGNRKLPRKTQSPVELKESIVNKAPYKSNVANTSPIKGQLDGSSPRQDDSPLFKRVQSLETPLSWRKRESPADSGIELSPISFSTPRLNPKVSL